MKLSIRAWLLCVILAAALPAILFFLVASLRLVDVERQALIRDLHERAGSLVNVLDRRLRTAATTAALLAESPLLAQQDFAGFHAYARRKVAEGGVADSVTLVGHDGRPVLNTLVPFGQSLPIPNYDYSQVFRTGKPMVTQLFIGAISKRMRVSVVVPVFAGGKVAYALSVAIDPMELSRIMVEQRLPSDWVAVLVDGNGVALARTVDPQRFLGQPVAPVVHEMVASGCLAPYRVRSNDGMDLKAVCRLLPNSPWALAVGAPEELWAAPLQRSTSQMIALGGAFLVGGGIVAAAFARHLVHNVNLVARSAVALGASVQVPVPATNISELDELGRGLVEAKRLIDAREAAITQAKAEAEAANRAKTDFLAAASHDLRQPFQAMRLYQTVLEAKAGPELEAVVAALGRAMASGEELLSAILDLSVLDAGKYAAKISEFAVSDVLAEVLDDCTPAAVAKGLSLRMVPTRLVIRSDRVLFKRMVRNLVVNAIKYTDKGGVLIGCRRRRASWQVCVFDTGIGMPEDRLAMIFEDFYQIGNPERDKTQGLGLGLAIVSRLSRLLRHKVAVTSRLGRGSTFAIEVEAG